MQLSARILSAPFIFLYGSDLLSLSDAYSCFCEFLDRFLLRLFSDDEFTALQWSFLKFKLLLLFHDPALATFLGKETSAPRRLQWLYAQRGCEEQNLTIGIFRFLQRSSM